MSWVILDRDGVINYDSEGYIKSPEEWLPIPQSLEAIKLLNDKGYAVAIATNQSGLQRQLYTEETLHLIHKKMIDELKAIGAHIEGVFYCPHGPHDGCLCRKPQPGLLHQIGKQFDLNLLGVPFVGDSFRDLEAAMKAGCTPVLVKTGNGLKTLQKHADQIKQISVYDDLYHFASELPKR